MEYLVKNQNGEWEICRSGVFPVGPSATSPSVYIVAWADRRGAFFCTNEDAIEVRRMPE